MSGGVSKTIRRCFKYRAYPNKGTRRRLWNTMQRGVTPVWNWCAGERRRVLNEYVRLCETARAAREQELGRPLADKEEKSLRNETAKAVKWPTKFSQGHFARKGLHPEYEAYNAQMLECTVSQVDGSWKSFMALRKNGNPDARPPRTQQLHSCLTFRQSGWKLAGDKLELMGIGTIRIRMHRPVQGKIKTVSIAEKNGEWYVCFSCEVTIYPGACGPVSEPKPSNGPTLREKYTPTGGSDPEKGGTHNRRMLSVSLPSGGSDPEKAAVVSLYFPGNAFLCDSTGRVIEHPAFYERALERTALLNQRLGRKAFAKPGMKEQTEGDFRGCNRRKARHTLAKHHEHIQRQRDYFLWQWARFYASNFQRIEVPKWPLKEKIQYAWDNDEARKLCDGAYGRFISMLRQKAEEFGSEVVEVKDETLWREQMNLITRIKQFETEKAFVHKAKKAVKYNNRKAFKKLAKQARELETTIQGV